MRLHEETAGTASAQIPPRAPAPKKPAEPTITALREMAHALLAGSPGLLMAPVFELRADDARSYRIWVNGSSRPLTLTRAGSRALTASREIHLPDNRPVVVLVERGAELSETDRAALASLTGHGQPAENTPRLCHGSLVLCGLEAPRWA